MIVSCVSYRSAPSRTAHRQRSREGLLLGLGDFCRRGRPAASTAPCKFGFKFTHALLSGDAQGGFAFDRGGV